MALPRNVMIAVVGALAIAGGYAAPSRGDTPAARALVADQLLEAARTEARNPNMPVALGNRAAMVLLQEAESLNPNSPDILRALAEAADVARKYDTELDALKNLVRLEPKNLVAQVQFLDLLALQRQTIEQKIGVYQAAFASTSLDPQVRSEMGVRLYRLLQQRGLTAEADADLTSAVQLNDTNVGALWELCGQLARTPGKTTEYMQALVNLLQANPYEPQALLSGANLLAGHNDHSLAADWLSASMEQTHAQGIQPPVGEYEALANELAAANRSTELASLLKNMLAIGKPPLPAMLLAYTVHAPQGVVPGVPDDPLLESIRKDMAATIAADPKNAQAQVDGIWFDLFYAPQVPADIGARMKALEGLVTPADPRYQRLYAWELLREGKLKAAKELFLPIQYTDVYASFGLIRIAEKEADSKYVAQALQDMYSAHPSGLLALHVINEAKKEGVTLAPTVLGQSLQTIAASYPQSNLTIDRHPRDVELLEPSLTKVRYNYGEPVILNLAITNTTDHALSVGTNGAIKVSVAIGASLQGLNTQDLGLCAMENSPRVYRLERHDTIQEQIRVDQGILRAVLLHDPARQISVGLTLVNEPLGALDHVVIGLGGQVLAAGGFEREGFAQLSVDTVNKLLTELPTLPLEERMLDDGALAMLSAQLKDQPGPSAPAVSGIPGEDNTAQQTMAQLKASIVTTLVARAQSEEPLEEVWLLQLAPATDLPQDLKVALDKAGSSTSALVRLAYYGRIAEVASADPDIHDQTVAELRKTLPRESDPQLKEWLSVLIAQLTMPPPATEPATAPASGPASEPATAPSNGPSTEPATAPATLPGAATSPPTPMGLAADSAMAATMSASTTAAALGHPTNSATGPEPH